MCHPNYAEITEVKRIFDPVVRETSRVNEAPQEVNNLLRDPNWHLLDFLACGDHLIWILGKTKD